VDKDNFNPTITKEELLATMDGSLFSMAFKDIERAANSGAQLGAFILASCFIDALAGFYSGVDRETCLRNNGERYQKFVGKYMPMYDAKKLWVDLRNGLVHAYAAGKCFAFTDGNKAGFSFDKTPSGAEIINLEDFLTHIKAAYAQLRRDILTDEHAFKNAYIRFSAMGLMQTRPIAEI
jgi:hypothetical protein